MRGKILSLVAAAALLASVGAANAKGPVTLTDNQLDKVTAGATAAGILANSTAALNSLVANANSPAALNNLLAITAQTVGFLSTP
jgi:predicted small lipoprotein YifL